MPCLWAGIRSTRSSSCLFPFFYLEKKIFSIKMQRRKKTFFFWSWFVCTFFLFVCWGFRLSANKKRMRRSETSPLLRTKADRVYSRIIHFVPFFILLLVAGAGCIFLVDKSYFPAESMVRDILEKWEANGNVLGVPNLIKCQTNNSSEIVYLSAIYHGPNLNTSYVNLPPGVYVFGNFDCFIAFNATNLIQSNGDSNCNQTLIKNIGDFNCFSKGISLSSVAI